MSFSIVPQQQNAMSNECHYLHVIVIRSTQCVLVPSLFESPIAISRKWHLFLVLHCSRATSLRMLLMRLKNQRDINDDLRTIHNIRIASNGYMFAYMLLKAAIYIHSFLFGIFSDDCLKHRQIWIHFLILIASSWPHLSAVQHIEQRKWKSMH